MTGDAVVFLATNESGVTGDAVVRNEGKRPFAIEHMFDSVTPWARSIRSSPGQSSSDDSLADLEVGQLSNRSTLLQ